MGDFQRIFRRFGIHKTIVDCAFDDHRTHGHRAIGELLCNIDDIGRDPKRLRTRIGAHTTKRGNHLVKDQQDVMLITDFTFGF